MKEPFDQPRLAINRVYTRQGDSGETGLVGGQRVPKDGTRIEAYGTVDELNSFLGAARATVNQLAVEEPRLALLAAILLRVQHELFNLGSILATLPEDVHPRQPRVTDAEIAQLETEMDLMNEDLPPLRSFVLPGGSRARCRTSHRPYRLPPRRAHRGRAEPHGKRAAGSHPLPEPLERRPVCLEPLGQPHLRRPRNFVGAKPVRLRAAGWIIEGQRNSTAASSLHRSCDRCLTDAANWGLT